MTIEANAYQKGKVSVAADGERLFICPVSYWRQNNGDFERRLTSAEYEEFIETAVLPYCTERAVNLLKYRDHSASELEKKLRRIMSAEIAARVVASLVEKSYLNDSVYARHIAEKLSDGKMMSKQGVYRELIGKGIARETAAETIEVLADNETEMLDALVANSLRGKPTDEKFWRRLYGKMLRLGYKQSAAAAAIRRAKTSGTDSDDYFCGGTDE